MEAHYILKMYLERKKIFFPQYSLRALARDLNISPAYVSAILSGKRCIPESKVSDFIKFLDLDDVAVLQLKRAMFPENLATDISKNPSSDQPVLSEQDKDFFDKYRPLDKKKYDLLNDWYNVAILDLTTCEDFENNSQWMARKLKISKLEVEIAIENLKRHGLLEETERGLEKTVLKLRFPSKVSQSTIRKFHKQMIKKAYEELDAGQESDFTKRLISGSTFAINLNKIEILKEKMQNALYEISNMASEGPCQSVYQFNIQFFPLVKE